MFDGRWKVIKLIFPCPCCVMLSEVFYSFNRWCSSPVSFHGLILCNMECILKINNSHEFLNAQVHRLSTQIDTTQTPTFSMQTFVFELTDLTESSIIYFSRRGNSLHLFSGAFNETLRRIKT